MKRRNGGKRSTCVNRGDLPYRLRHSISSENSRQALSFRVSALRKSTITCRAEGSAWKTSLTVTPAVTNERLPCSYCADRGMEYPLLPPVWLLARREEEAGSLLTCDRRATTPATKREATLRAKGLSAGGFVARSSQICADRLIACPSPQAKIPLGRAYSIPRSAQ